MIDGALNTLRHKAHDVEAWLKKFERAAKAGDGQTREWVKCFR